ncbi:MAG TPA: 16S rRNA (guanine(527)-N(7))-methyltransferase RsmG [Herpetosiphonaceae bacterium]|nr:16S rRNA (guanine(527)-N(7))-methyltransferase RsmG [Herpetosiphonaceae bacterium]
MESIAHELELHVRELLVPTAARWGLSIGEREIGLFVAYGVELLQWNERVNLTRITAPRDVVVRHFLDSLACARAFAAIPSSLADIGTGAGFPGIPLKLVWPATRLMLSDSVAKKTAFLDHVAAVLDLHETEIVTARAEELGRDPRHRERYAGVVARAVAALNVLAEYTLPLCRVGGRFVAPKGSDGAVEAEQARRAIEQLGGKVSAIVPVELPGVELRTLIVVDKQRPTPAGLPRTVGIPAKRPL